MSQTKAQLVSGTTAQDLTVDNINTTSINSGQLSNRRVNRNGSFIISQKNRDTEVTLGSSGDRWIDLIQTFLHNTATFKAQRVSDAPAGFQYSAKHTVSSADGSVANSDEAMFIHRMEGFDTAKFAYGTAGAKQVTVSFYVKSSLTGDFSFAAQTGGRNYINEYTISSANTWERHSFTLPVLTDGTHNTTTGAGLSLIWDLGSGDDYATSTLGSWVTASNLYRSTGAVRLSTNLNATWQITGIQVEEGTTATDFEHFPVAIELELCQRYYIQYDRNNSTADDGLTSGMCVLVAGDNNDCFGFLQLPTCMRSNPTIAYSSADHFETTRVFSNTNVVGGTIFIAYASAHPHQSIFLRTNSAPNPSFSSGDTFCLRMKNQTAAIISFSAQL